jgi:hypothetical protein
VGANQVDLQFANLIAGNADVAEFADAGGDGVSDLIAFDNVFDYGAGAVDGFPGFGVEKDWAAFDGNFFSRFQS